MGAKSWNKISPNASSSTPKLNAHRSSCILSSSTPSVSTKPNERFSQKDWKSGAARSPTRPGEACHNQRLKQNWAKARYCQEPMQSRETGRMTRTKSSSNPIAPSEPQQWGSFRFRNTAFSTNRNARACRESRSHRCHKQPPDSACAHGNSPRPAPPRKARIATTSSEPRLFQ